MNKTITLPMISLRGLVLYPNMILNFDVSRDKSVKALSKAMDTDQTVFMVSQKDIKVEEPTLEDLYTVGVVGRVKQILKMPNNILRVVVEGQYRAGIVGLETSDPYFVASVEELPIKDVIKKDSVLASGYVRRVQELFQEYCLVSGKMPKEMLMVILDSNDPNTLVEYCAGNLMLKVSDKQEILEQTSVMKRLKILCAVLENENSILRFEQEIFERTREKIDINQREYFLREQQRIINEELGEDESVFDEAYEFRMTIDSLKVTEEIKIKLFKEVDRLYKCPAGSQEANVIRTYIETCLELPWDIVSKNKIDIVKSRKILDNDHYGLSKVKERIIESLAVRKLAPDIKGQIICLVGPPGVGKTSIAKSIANSMGRKYVRLSLGGIKDESEIRGHRKTYVGSMPGRIINALKQAGTRNPLMLLDEIDKLGNDFRGDPSSALLEVLDSEQNKEFRDHYIELPFDLSEVFFITTANTLSTIPAPLLDRMEVIELSSYTREEKFHIAKDHLIKKQLKKHGLKAANLKISDDVIFCLIDSYIKEAGVRNLERIIAKLCRKTAKAIVGDNVSKVNVTINNIEDFLGPKRYKKDNLLPSNEIGVVTGLAWTSVGGETMPVEVLVVDGTGKLELTGQLGDVMKESAKAAITYVRFIADKLGIDKDFYKNKDIHIHVPEGAIPKDGPSAGVTITTALVSALTKIPVKREVAMTGEISLRGHVLPIGGLKEKTMAAYSLGIKTVLIPIDNKPDLAEIDETVAHAINFIPVDTIDEVLENALLYSYKQPINVEKQNLDLPLATKPIDTVTISQ